MKEERRDAEGLEWDIKIDIKFVMIFLWCFKDSKQSHSFIFDIYFLRFFWFFGSCLMFTQT